MKNVKKIEFAIQVFGLIVMIPTYLVLEMNHGGVKSQQSTPTSIKIEGMEMEGFANSRIQNEKTFELKFQKGILLRDSILN